MNWSVAYREDIVLKRWEDFPPLSEATRISLLVIMSITLVVGSVGNTLVLVLFSKYRSLRTTANMFVINLAVVDLLMCVLCLPVLMKNCLSKTLNNDFGFTMCKVDAFLGAYVGFVTILSLAALAIDRCYVINRKTPVPINDDKTAVYVAIVIIWIVAAGGASMPIVGFGNYVQDASKIFCTFDFFTRSFTNIAYNMTIQLMYFFIPVTSIATCYSLIFFRVRSHEHKYFRDRNSSTYSDGALRRTRRNKQYERNELKTAKAGIILVTVFCVSWLPYSIVSLVALWGNSSVITPLSVSLPAIFAKLSTILNPVFYALIHRRFKHKLKLCVKKYAYGPPSQSNFSSKSRQLNIFQGYSDYHTLRLLSIRDRNFSTV